MFLCPMCPKSFEKINSLSVHYRNIHKNPVKDLYIYHYLNGIEPKCGCGCGSAVKFLDITRGFTKYVRGHASRVKNNFNSEKSKINSLETRRKMLEQGTWKPFASNETGNVWNAGLTKKDPRIAASISKRETEEYKKKASERMKEARLSGKIPTQTKENHSQWRGGISPLNVYCRANRKLYTEWKYPLLEKAQFKCQECSKPGPGLEIHHDKEKMSDIIHRFAAEYGWSGFYSMQSETDISTIEIKMKISDAVAQYHIDNNVSGKVLCEACHKEQH